MVVDFCAAGARKGQIGLEEEEWKETGTSGNCCFSSFFVAAYRGGVCHSRISAFGPSSRHETWPRRFPWHVASLPQVPLLGRDEAVVECLSKRGGAVQEVEPRPSRRRTYWERDSLTQTNP